MSFFMQYTIFFDINVIKNIQSFFDTRSPVNKKKTEKRS